MAPGFPFPSLETNSNVNWATYTPSTPYKYSISTASGTRIVIFFIYRDVHEVFHISVSLFFFLSLLPCFSPLFHLKLLFFPIPRSKILIFLRFMNYPIRITFLFGLNLFLCFFLKVWFLFFYICQSIYAIEFGCVSWMPMGIEKTSSVRKGKHSWESGKSRRRQKRLSPVQVLYNTCKEVFANCGHGIVPSPEKIERLKAVLGMLLLYLLWVSIVKFANTRDVFFFHGYVQV